MVEGVVDQREGAELLAVLQVEEEDFHAVVLGAQVEEPQEVGLEAGGPADLEVAVVVVEVEVGLAVEDVEVGVSEGRSSAACKDPKTLPRTVILSLYIPLPISYRKAGKK